MQITGVPTQTGTYTFTLQAQDSGGHTATLVLTIVVTAEELPGGGGPPPPKRWLWTFNNPQPDGSQIASITQAASRQLIVRRGATEHDEASVDIQGGDLAAQQTTGLTLAADIQVWLEGSILFCGRLGTEQDSNDGTTGPRFNPVAYDYREVLRRRTLSAVTPPSYSGQDRGFIAWDLITKTQALPGGNLGIARGRGQSTGTVSTATYTKDQGIGQAIDDLAQMDAGFDWMIAPHGAADLRLDLWAGGRGQDNGVLLEWGGPMLASYNRVTDPSAYGNNVLVSTSGGATPINPVYAQAGDLATRPEGRWDLSVGTQLTTADALATAAPWYLAQGEVVNPSYTLVMQAGAWGGPDHIWVGDVVQLRIKDGRLAVDDKLPVSEMQFDLDPDNNETVTLTVGRSTFGYRHPIARILRRLAALEQL